MLITDKINGVSGTPFRIRVYNTPVFPQDNEDTLRGISRTAGGSTESLTFNLGVRWEYQHSYLPEQDYAGARDFATVFPAKHVDLLDVQTFNRRRAAGGRGLRSGRQVGHQGDLGTLQLHPRRHLRRRVCRHRDRERRCSSGTT